MRTIKIKQNGAAEYINLDAVVRFFWRKDEKHPEVQITVHLSEGSVSTIVGKLAEEIFQELTSEERISR